MSTHRAPGAERGVALVLVLWVIALLTVMALGLTATQRTETALIRNQMDAARFRALADSSVTYAMMRLQSPAAGLVEPAEIWIPNGSPRRWRFAGETLEITVSNEASRIDLNHAESDRLESLLLVVGAEPDLAASLANRILDWRDEDDVRLLDGAEDPDYEAAGLPYGAKDGPFDAVEELQQVLGMTQALYRRLAPALSTDIGSDRVEETLAAPLVIAALHGLTLAEAEERVLLRDEPIAPSSELRPNLDQGGPVYRVRVTWLVGGRQTRTMETLVVSNPGSRPPYQIRWRRTGLVSTSPALAAEAPE